MGHFYLELGGGDVVVGDFGSIEWDETNYSLEVSFDLDGGSNYKVIGNSSILAVPIALYARKSDHAAVADSVIHAPTIINSPWIKDEDGGLLYSPDGDFYVYINPEGSIQLGDSLQFAQFNTNGFHNSQNFISEKVSPEDEKNNQMMGQKMTGTGNADITLGQNPNVPESTEIKGESLDLIAREGTFCGLSATTFIAYILEADQAHIDYIFGLNVEFTNGTITNLNADRIDAVEICTQYIVLQTEESGEICAEIKKDENGVVFLQIYGSDGVNLKKNQHLLGGINGDGGINIVGMDPSGNTDWGCELADNQARVLYLNGSKSTFDPEIALISANGQGTLVADVKNFKMKSSIPGKEIWYASLEGPEAGAYERGVAKLVNGEVFVPYSNHYTEVVNASTATVLLTPHSADSKGLAVIEKLESGFRIKELFDGTGNYQFDWEVKAVRRGYEKYKVIRKVGATIPQKIR